MGEHTTERGEAEAARGGRGWRWRVGVVMLAAAAVVGLLWLSDVLTARSAEQQLAAIEAARAIPDDENAAVIYKRLFEDWTARNASVDMEKRLGAEAIIFEPWSSEEYPEADAFLETEQRTMGLLKEACEKRKCWFGLPANVNAFGRMDTIYMTMLRWQRVLSAAANRDIGEGRVGTGVKKYGCALQMAKHLCEQPQDCVMGFSLELGALRAVRKFIVQAGTAERHLCIIEGALQTPEDRWHERWARLSEIEGLLTRKWFTFSERLRARWQSRGIAYKTPEEEFKSHYHFILANRRATLVLVALRRYRNSNGKWPQSLEDIKGSAPPEAFVDSINGGRFGYKLTDEGFTLYSRGENNIDENGIRKGGADDWCIWPPAGSKIEPEDANASSEQSINQ